MLNCELGSFVCMTVSIQMTLLLLNSFETQRRRVTFSATSDGSKDGLNFRQGGLCLEHNLRLKIVIKQQKEEKMDGGGVYDPDVEYDADDSDIFDDGNVTFCFTRSFQ